MATLNAFLRSDELDETIALSRQLENLSAADTKAVRGVLEAWTDEQAVANLLMYSHLLPDDIRVETLLHGLNQQSDSYAVLAALVGLQDLELDEDVRAAVVQRLVEIIANGPAVTAARATVLLGQLAHTQDADTFVRLLNHPDDTLRHNVLVALINAVGLENVTAFIDRAASAGTITPAAKAYAGAKLAGSERFFQNGELDYSQWYLSDLSAPLLAYIPNLKDF